MTNPQNQAQQKAAQDYKAVNLGSASKEELVVMLFEAAHRLQVKARIDIEAGREADARAHLRRVRDIFGELVVSLDHSAAPEMTANLARLYTWVINESSKAGLERNAEILDGTIRVTQMLMEGFTHAFRGPQEQP
jgi:flagellar protein FliS